MWVKTPVPSERNVRLFSVPPPVSNLHVVRTSMIAVRVAWDPPNFEACDSLKGYQVYLSQFEKKLHRTMNEMWFNRLFRWCWIRMCQWMQCNGQFPHGGHNLSDRCLCCECERKRSSNKHRCGHWFCGRVPMIESLWKQRWIFSWSGDSLPAPPTFFSVARREILVKWQPPETISGRLNRYQLICNGKTIYSGTDQECRATELKPDKEYSMHVIVFTSEGQFRSRTMKTRTLKDECSYNVEQVEKQNVRCLFWS